MSHSKARATQGNQLASVALPGLARTDKVSVMVVRVGYPGDVDFVCPGCGQTVGRRYAHYPQAAFRPVASVRISAWREWVACPKVYPAGTPICWRCWAMQPEYASWEAWQRSKRRPVVASTEEPESLPLSRR